MLKIRVAFVLFTLFNGYIASSQIVNIPDENFKNKLIDLGIDTDNDGEISYDEAANVYGHLTIWNCGIAYLTGIKAFVSIDYLNSCTTEMPSLRALCLISGSSERTLEYAF